MSPVQSTVERKRMTSLNFVYKILRDGLNGWSRTSIFSFNESFRLNSFHNFRFLELMRVFRENTFIQCRRIFRGKNFSLCWRHINMFVSHRLGKQMGWRLWLEWSCQTNLQVICISVSFLIEQKINFSLFFSPALFFVCAPAIASVVCHRESNCFMVPSKIEAKYGDKIHQMKEVIVVTESDENTTDTFVEANGNGHANGDTNGTSNTNASNGNGHSDSNGNGTSNTNPTETPDKQTEEEPKKWTDEQIKIDKRQIHEQGATMQNWMLVWTFYFPFADCFSSKNKNNKNNKIFCYCNFCSSDPNKP